jgi:hypothetical protein
MEFGTPLRLLKDLLLSQRSTDRFRSRVNCFIAQSFVATLLNDERNKEEKRLLRYGRKVYSQSDEDGIIHEIFKRIGTSSQRFIEIGAADGLENNTVWLLRQGWSGTWVEGSPVLGQQVATKFAPMIGNGRLKILTEFVTRESAARLAKEGAFSGVDLFSLDIDGNDYHVMAAIEALDARVIVVEYNAKFPPPHRFAMRYDESYRWDLTDNFGVSLAAWDELLRAKGYSLVGCNISGSNAFFVRTDLVDGKFCEPLTPENHYEPARYWLISGFVSGHPANFGANHFDT